MSQGNGARPTATDETCGWKGEFQRFHRATQQATPSLLHFAAHSHHFWADVTFEAQQQAWLDAASMVDEKWDHIFGSLIPSVRGHIARTLELSDRDSLAFAPNTHELLVRLFSSVEKGSGGPVKILSTDGEFHSFRRQSLRWEEAGACTVERVSTQPFETFAQRFLDTAAEGGHDLVFVSQVFFDSGLVFDRLADLAALLEPECLLVVDAYHGFMALPTSWHDLEGRAFYLSGAYKYAMAGEGACFLHCPPGCAQRPVDTGWYGAFGDLEKSTVGEAVPYAIDGNRFFGATFDPSGLYRLNAVMDRWLELGVSVDDLHQHTRRLQEAFLDGLGRQSGELGCGDLVLPRTLVNQERSAHFLTFQKADAAGLHHRMRQAGIMTDVRGNRLRIGFGAYQDEQDVAELLRRLAQLS